MKKRSKLRKGLAILLSLAMVVGLVPGVGTMKVSAAEGSAAEETGTAAGITYTPLAGNPEGYNSQWGDERYSKLLDGTADTKWCCSFTNPSYVIFKTSEPVYVNGYSIWTANDTGSESGRNPVAWTLSGCNDYNETDKTGGNWVTIHEVTGAKTEDALPAANETEKSYSFAESGYSYQYFKLNITGIKSGTTMQLGDFSLTYGACKHQWVKTETTIPPTCTEGGYDVERCSLCQATRNVANNVPATGHDFGENGLCTRCGASDTTPSKPNGEGTEQSPYQISTVGELNWFAGLVNGTLDGVTQNTSAYAVLATDINFGDNSFVAIGTETYPFSGTFDGSGHTITVNQSESTDVALFGFLGNSTVKNLTVTGTINTTTTKFAAGIAMQTKTGTTATVENCISDVTIESNISGDGTHAGLIGVPNGAVNINNCAFTGAINGASTNACGGMIGYAKGTVTIKNSYIAATFNLAATSCHTFSRNFTDYVTLDNCYYLNALGDVPASATQLTDEQFSSGEAAYLLQREQTGAVWGQNIDNGQTKQNYPVPGGAKVYKNITYQCPGSSKVDNTEYSNTEKDAAYGEHAMQKIEAKAATCTEAGNKEHWICSYEEGVYYKDENGKNTYDTVVIPATGHSFGEDGICTNEGCSISNKTVAKPKGDGTANSPYQISTAGELFWFAGLVNGTLTDVTQDTSASAVLTQDITVNTGVLDGDGKLTSNPSSFTDWTPIGIRINGNDIKYTGTFDGKGHTISGLYFADSTVRLGFFGYVGSGGSVSNVGIVDSYFSGGDYAGGVCGVNFGSVTNCYHTGAVNGINAGGVCGVNSGSITNCYHTGAVSGTDAGGVCGGNDSSGNITNCYYETMDGIAGGIKGSDVTGKAQGKATKEFSDGVVAYLLSSGTDGSIWGQTLTGEGQQVYPVLGGAAVYRICKNGSASYSNHDGESVHQYDNGICSGCGVYKVPAYINDCYQIANKGNLYWFAGLVNGDASVCTGGVTQNNSASAVLTQDITVNTGVLDGDGKLTSNPSSFTAWTPIGNLINDKHIMYTGTFDGKGHTISGLYYAGSTSYLGFFGYVGSGGSVSNVGIVDSYFSGGNYAGGVCGENCGSITNCYHTGVVSGTTYVGGVCGVNYGSITNCYHTGAVSGTDAGGVCGRNSGSITNCYYETMDGIAGGIKGSDVTGKAEGKATKEFSDGVVAYLLSSGTDGSIWGQTLTGEGQQDYPVLGGEAVYRICKNGGVSYSNREGDNEHLYDNGICSGCGVYEVPAYKNDCYQITNKGNLYWFAGLVNGDAKICTGDVTQNTSASAVLTQDITVNTGVLDGGGILTSNPSSFTGWIPIGNLINDKHIMYTGIFDGKGHTISGLYYAGSTSRLGFFGYVGRGGSVSNVGIVDSYFSGGTYAGGVCGDNYGTIKNCYYAGAVSGTNAGGVCGTNRSSSNITNCYHTGAVSGTYAGGVCGDNSGSITNCYHTGAVSGTNTGGVCGYNYSSASITNCYYETMDGITGGIDGSDVTGKAQGKATKEFSDGVVAYLLSHGSIDGSIWGQTLTGETKQAYPVLGGAAVYTVCKNGSASYANHEGDNEHQYDNGICSGCGVYEVPVYKDECYQIANKGNLYWFAGLVNGDIRICTGDIKQDTSAKAVLTQDITVNTGVLDANGELAESETGFTSWTPIGNETKPYTGTFDGKGCKIEGLYFKDTSAESVGLFGRIGDGEGVCICNVGIVDSYLHGKSEVGGICGQSYRSTITNCYHTGSVRGNSSVGGVCGYNYYSTITNCYHTGLVSGTTTSVGGVCGRSENNNNFTNCYYETMDGITGGIKGSDVTGKAEGKITERFNDGEVAYLLSRGCTYDGIYYDGSAWGQNLTGEGQQAYPVFGGSKVYLKGTYTGCECNPGEPTSTDGYSNNKEDSVYGEHTMTAHSANNATCTKDGNLAYWTCSNGEGLYYKDEAGTEKYNSYEDDIKLPATGHKDQNGDGICENCSAYVDGIGARLAGHSLTLDGSVGVNFYMELSSEVISDNSAYMEFTLPGGKTSKVNVSDADTEEISGTTYYKFRCQVNAAEMTDTITAQLKSTVGNSKVYEYTVKEYADYLFAHKDENAEFGKAAALIKAMVNYGSYAQIYAGYNADNLAVGDKGNLKSVDDVTIDEYTYQPSEYETKVQFAGANLSLLSTTTLRMYFKITDIDAERVTIGYRGQELEKTQSGDYYYVELVGIPASKLDDEFVIDVHEDTNIYTVTYTPMAYCANVVNRETTETRTVSLKNLMKALAVYNQAADAYIANTDNGNQ